MKEKAIYVHIYELFMKHEHILLLNNQFVKIFVNMKLIIVLIYQNTNCIIQAGSSMSNSIANFLIPSYTFSRSCGPI